MSRPVTTGALVTLSDALDGSGNLASAAGAVVEFARRHFVTDHVGIALHESDATVVRLAVSSPLVAALDEVQARLGHGPGTELLGDGSAITITDTLDDTLWPGWSAAAAGLDVRAVRMVGLPTLRGRCVSLDLYAHEAHAFATDDLVETGHAARYAGLGLRQVDRLAHLQEALQTRALIGQGQGILMERYLLTGDQAMSYLRRWSQESQTKVRDLAQFLVDTGDRAASSRDGAPGGSHGGTPGGLP